MPRRLRRPAVALGAALLLPVLAACGSGSDGTATDPFGSSPSTDASASTSAAPSTPTTSAATTAATPAPEADLSALSISGDVGKALDATFTTTVPVPAQTSTKTLVTGTGDPVASGDTVSAYIWIGDGTTKKVAYSDYTTGAPESLPNTGQLGTVFEKIFAGATYGSRIAAITTPAELLGSASSGSQLGIGAKDSIVVVADLVQKVEESPTPTDDQVHDAPASSMPKVVETKGKPTGLDWTGVKEPALTTPVQRTVLKAGTGAVVKATDTVTVNYLGETYQAKTPFDESYSGTPLNSPLSGLIPGWATGLAGVKVGSRVLLQIPPAYAYGAQGSGSSIPGNSTLWFVIDVVKVG